MSQRSATLNADRVCKIVCSVSVPIVVLWLLLSLNVSSGKEFQITFHAHTLVISSVTSAI